MNYRLRVRAIIPYKNKILLVKNSGMTTSWCLPGGAVEDGEKLVDALKREIFEELGVHAVVGMLLFVHQFEQDGLYSWPEFFFLINNSEDFVNLDLSKARDAKVELWAAEFCDVERTEILPRFLATKIPELMSNNFNAEIEYILS